MSGFYERLAPFIQDYIYRHKWDELRDVQTAACSILFDTNLNLLLSSGTASGKTEAAFLPVLTLLEQNPSRSVGVLYVSPLKALINDQFYRLEELLEEGHIPVTKWHGDVSSAAKDRLLRNPQGILQITPESLEAMLMRRSSTLHRLFGDLRFVVIDEVHYFMGAERGAQLLCILERLARIIGYSPRRIGLSATVGDPDMAGKWLSQGSGIGYKAPRFSSKGRRVRLSVEYFPLSDEAGPGLYRKEDYYQYLLDITKGRRCILFSNSKAEVEENIAYLKRLAKRQHLPDIYFVHHGNVSASLREVAEQRMKQETGPMVTGATVTLELGIDLGNLERIVQTGTTYSVSSFVQRLGRTGRRGNPSEMWFAFRREVEEEDDVLYRGIHWEFLYALAVIRLYLRERWIEPIAGDPLPYGLLYHQTMSFRAGAGEASPAVLAQNLLTLTPFQKITKEEYRELLLYMLDRDQLEKTETGTLMIGLRGEQKINDYDFFSVFETGKEITVCHRETVIGTIQEFYPPGTRFSLAGQNWEVLEVESKQGRVYVTPVRGFSANTWVTPFATAVHTRIMKTMRDVLWEDTVEPYLQPTAALHLQETRNRMRRAQVSDTGLLPLSGSEYALFSWLGTKALMALSYALKQAGVENTIYFQKFIPVCLLIHWPKEEKALAALIRDMKSKPLDKFSFPIPPEEAPPGKFNEFIPASMLRRQYIENYIDVEDMQANLLFWRQ